MTEPATPRATIVTTWRRVMNQFHSMLLLPT
jgi:hypothetical protein